MERHNGLEPDPEGAFVYHDAAQATIAALEETILKMGENVAVVAKDAMAAKEQVAALQARVKELEQWVQNQSTANLETMRHTDEMQSRALEAEQQLTQRTAELEAAKAQHKDLVLRNRILRDRLDLPVERTSFHDEVVKLQAELERVRAALEDACLSVAVHGEQPPQKWLDALQHRQGME